MSENNLAFYFQQFTTQFPKKDGTVRYATAAVVPSNSIGNRVLALTLEGLIKPNPEGRYDIVWDFTNVASDRTISLEGPLQGQFNLGCHTWNAKKILTYDASEIADRILRLSIRLPNALKSKQNFFLNIQINDLGGSAAPGTTTCNVLNNVIQQVENQLTSMFPPGGAVGAVYTTLIINGKPVQLEVLTPSDFTVSTSSFDLPPYFSYPQEISMIGPKNTWDNFTFLAGPNSSTLFYVALNEMKWFILSKTGYPVCSNIWVDIYNFGLTDIQVSNLFFFNLQADTSTASCLPLNNSRTEVVYTIPFTMNTSPVIDVYFNGNGDTRSGFCDYKDFFTGECGANLNAPCPKDQVTIATEIVSGTINIFTSITVSASLTFTSSYDSNIQNFVINNIEIINVQNVQFENTIVNWRVSPPTLTNTVINLLGGVNGIKEKVSSFAQRELNKLVPTIVGAINQSLKNLVITL